MNKVVILLGGPLLVTQRLLREVRGSRVIAADSGMAHAEALGLAPELWVGDFDSSPPELLEKYPKVEKKVYPSDKDQTDGELAVEAALAMGASELWLLGALGGRSDHGLSHLLLSIKLTGQGVKVVLSGGKEEARPLVGGGRAAGLEAGTLFSIVPLSDLAGLTIRGAHWELKDATIPLGSSHTLSNRARAGLEISLAQGQAVLFTYFDDL